MGVEFIDVDVEAFRQAVLPLHEQILESNQKLQPIYEEIQTIQEGVADNGEGETQHE